MQLAFVKLVQTKKCIKRIVYRSADKDTENKLLNDFVVHKSFERSLASTKSLKVYQNSLLIGT